MKKHWLEYQQRIIFQNFKQKEKFIKMITEFSVSTSTISFKIAILGLINQYPKMKNSSLCFLEKYMWGIENGSKFQQAKKTYLNPTSFMLLNQIC